MKYSIPITLVLCCILGATARAQEATAPVLADVTQHVTLTSSGQTNFGTIGNFEHTERIDPAEPTATQTTAVFALSSSGGLVTYTCPSEVTLTEPVSSAVMTFTPELSAAETSDQSSSIGSPVQCGNGFLGPTQAWIWLGGSLGVGPGQALGRYSGEFTLSVVY